ncbi:hypothetical protein POSPLADRAFT_1054530 [Postia placenta MAD-698-R-SB12]|uniref:Uncharacterized protein n=1 Tax=Postia placenta MAD-698-R-SB12 TaxID=670580 RepID=A0A1X6N667_9APHY|nr:hypothetical protein POSPLADRAFT_1054530 [Postia placenta MAD-698-R-SB12]OSX63903.1 hypothetical protein POSPLADRAFT_1054530 [Postia placenta MAD-698-R-SB12]
MQFSRLSVLVAFLSLVVLAATGSPISDTDTAADTEADGQDLIVAYYDRRRSAN